MSEHSAENDAPRVFDAAIFRHTYNPWTGKCGCGEGPFSVAEHRGHVERAMSAKCPDCGHSLPHHERWGCMAEVGEGGSGSVADAVFCKCVFSPDSTNPVCVCHHGQRAHDDTGCGAPGCACAAFEGEGN